MGRCSDARDRLLASAATLVNERGYSALSVADICAHAGLKKGSFYHFFPSKQALVLVTLDEFKERYRALMAEVRGSSDSAHSQLAELLRRMGQHMSDAMAQEGNLRGCPVGKLALEMSDRDEQLRAKVAEIFAIWREALESILRAGIERQELSLSDPKAIAETIIAQIQGAILLAKTANSTAVFERIAANTTKLLGPEPLGSGAQLSR